MKFHEFGTIQDRCKGCPQLTRLIEFYDASDDEIKELLEAGMDGSALSLYKEMLAYDEQIPQDIAAAVMSDQTEQIRSELVAIVDVLTERHDLQAALIDKMQRNCDEGTLKLRATRRGTQVIVSLCMSEMLSTFIAEHGWEPTTVVRKAIE
jgi:hypothetical protein